MEVNWQTGLGPIALQEPLYLGILNATPDSFSDGGRYLDPQAALVQVARLVAQGIGVLDLGAESTRKGALPVTAEAEWARMEPVLAAIRAAWPELPVSLDTRHALVAARGLRAGAAIINDVTGFSDPELLRVVRGGACGLIAMRCRLEGRDLAMPAYDVPVPGQPQEGIQDLRAIRDRLLGEGIQPERILLDPGFGFGTSFTGDLALWQALPRLPAALDWPVQRFCIGISRKRFLAFRAGQPGLPAGQRDALTAQAHREAMAAGYRVFRTHAAQA